MCYFLFAPISLVTLFGPALGFRDLTPVFCVTWTPAMVSLAHGQYWQECAKWGERPGVFLPCPSSTFLAAFCLLVATSKALLTLSSLCPVPSALGVTAGFCRC